MSEKLKKIGELIRTQDNRATDCPIFIVQEQRRDYGYNPDWSDESAWLDTHNDYNEASDDLAEHLDSLDGETPERWQKVYYKDRWVFVTACFTEQACKDFIKEDGHNHGKLRIYAAGSYRNHEFRAVRDYLESLATPELPPQPETVKCHDCGHDWPFDDMHGKAVREEGKCTNCSLKDYYEANPDYMDLEDDRFKTCAKCKKKVERDSHDSKCIEITGQCEECYQRRPVAFTKKSNPDEVDMTRVTFEGSSTPPDDPDDIKYVDEWDEGRVAGMQGASDTECPYEGKAKVAWLTGLAIGEGILRGPDGEFHKDVAEQLYGGGSAE